MEVKVGGTGGKGEILEIKHEELEAKKGEKRDKS